MPPRKRGGNPEEAGIPHRLKKMGIFRRLRSASLGDTSKTLTKGGKRVAPSPPEDRLSKEGKGGMSLSYAAATIGQTPQKDGEWQLVVKN